MNQLLPSTVLTKLTRKFQENFLENDWTKQWNFWNKTGLTNLKIKPLNVQQGNVLLGFY